MVSAYCLVFLSVLCCSQAYRVMPQQFNRRNNVMAMQAAPMEGMGMMGGYAPTYHQPSLSADERASLFVKLFECGTPGMPRCDMKYAAFLERLFRNIADNIESKMQQHMMDLRQVGMISPTMTQSFGSRGLFGDRWSDVKNWFSNKLG